MPGGTLVKEGFEQIIKRFPKGVVNKSAPEFLQGLKYTYDNALKGADEISDLVKTNNLNRLSELSAEGNLAQQGAQTTKQLRNVANPEGVVVPFRHSNRTPSKRAKSNPQEIRDFLLSPEGVKQRQFAQTYSDDPLTGTGKGSLAGLNKTEGYEDITLPDGDIITWRQADTGKVKPARKSNRKADADIRTKDELVQTHGKADWNKVMPGFTDPKNFPAKSIEGHHKYMISGYKWAFDGATPKEAKIITKYFHDKGVAFGKTQFNRQNIPKPVHKAIHAWMDSHLGLNGLDMPKLTGLSPQERIKAIETYLEYVQPAMDEATYDLMKRYRELGDSIDWSQNGSHQALFKEGVSMVDQFTDKVTGMAPNKAKEIPGVLTSPGADKDPALKATLNKLAKDGPSSLDSSGFGGRTNISDRD